MKPASVHCRKSTHLLPQDESPGIHITYLLCCPPGDKLILIGEWKNAKVSTIRQGYMSLEIIRWATSCVYRVTMYDTSRNGITLYAVLELAF